MSSQSYSQGSSSGSQSSQKSSSDKGERTRFHNSQGKFLRITKQLIRAGYNRFYDPLRKVGSSKYRKIYFQDKLTTQFVKYINFLRKPKDRADMGYLLLNYLTDKNADSISIKRFDELEKKNNFQPTGKDW